MLNASPHQRPRGVPFGRRWAFLAALLFAWALSGTQPLRLTRASAQEPAAPSRIENENEAEAARGVPIGNIKVAGNRRITSDDILAYLTEKVGQPFSPETLAKDVRELWNSGFFDDIEVTSIKSVEDFIPSGPRNRLAFVQVGLWELRRRWLAGEIANIDQLLECLDEDVELLRQSLDEKEQPADDTSVMI